MTAKTITVDKIPETKAKAKQSMSWLSMKDWPSESRKAAVEVYTVVRTVTVVEMVAGVTGFTFEEEPPILSKH